MQEVALTVALFIGALIAYSTVIAVLAWVGHKLDLRQRKRNSCCGCICHVCLRGHMLSADLNHTDVCRTYVVSDE